MTEESLEDLALRLKKVNAECKNHRLNTEAAKEEIEVFREKIENLEVVRRKLKSDHEVALRELKADYGQRIASVQKERDEAKSSASKRIIDADLKLAARDAGMVDLDGLKLLDREGVKLDDDGNVTNAAELLAAMKEAKPYLFGAVAAPGTMTGTTTSTAKKPAADASGKKVNALEMSKEEYQNALRGVSGASRNSRHAGR